MSGPLARVREREGDSSDPLAAWASALWVRAPAPLRSPLPLALAIDLKARQVRVAPCNSLSYATNCEM